MASSFWLFILLFNYFGTVVEGEKNLLPQGCFSKNNLDTALNYSTSKVVWFKENIKETRACSDACKGFDLIGIQYQLCLCIKLSVTNKLLQIPDKCCKYVGRNNATHFGGYGAFALHCLPHFACSGFQNKSLESSECENISVEIEREAKYKTFKNFNPSQIGNSDVGLRFNKNGEVCPDLVNKNQQTTDNDRNISGAMQLFIEYTPDLKAKPYLCQNSCDVLKISHKNNFPVVSKLRSSILGDIEWCQCSNNLADFRTQHIQICNACPTDLKDAERDCPFQNEKVMYFSNENKTDCESRIQSSSMTWLYITLGCLTLMAMSAFVIYRRCPENVRISINNFFCRQYHRTPVSPNRPHLREPNPIPRKDPNHPPRGNTNPPPHGVTNPPSHGVTNSPPHGVTNPPPRGVTNPQPFWDANPPILGHQNPPISGYHHPTLSGHQNPTLPGYQNPPLTGLFVLLVVPLPGYQNASNPVYPNPLSTGNTNSPTPGDLNSPTPGDLNSPTPGDLNSPTSGYLNSPTPGDLNSPTPGDLNSPTSGDLNSPTSGDLNSPTSGDPNSPTSGDPNSLVFGDTNPPRSKPIDGNR